jgi:hypothetical protein
MTLQAGRTGWPGSIFERGSVKMVRQGPSREFRGFGADHGTAFG